ncbi:MAG: alcohol dehydrogenase catalytic domain-containing protein [Thermodesulfobacteriota bacterium]
MEAMVLRRLCDLRREAAPLSRESMPDPEPRADDVLLEVSVCGVCHTEIDEIEGRTPPRTLPMILGHQAVGRVIGRGAAAARIAPGTRVGVAWISSACGSCRHCLAGDENLCPEFVATGRDVPGGYAERMVVPEAFAHPIPGTLSDVSAAPLLCAGAIGWRSLRLTGMADGDRLGLTGFGASGHLVLGIVRRRFPRSEVYVFARNAEERAFARELGAVWTGDSGDVAPAKLHAIIDTTPAWKPALGALANLEPGGRLVVNAIRKESADRQELAAIDYARHLWMEKEVKSVANVTRADVRELLAFAAESGIVPEATEAPLADANRVLVELKRAAGRGAKVLRVA